MTGSAYQPYQPVRRPGGKPAGKPRPGRRPPGGRRRPKLRYRVLVHRKFPEILAALPERVGLASAQQFYDHVASAPGRPAPVNRTGVLRGRAGEPMGPGFSRTIHYEISGAGRIDYQYHDTYAGGSQGDPHPVVFIRAINLSSH